MAETRRNYITAAEVNTLVGVTPTDQQLDTAEALIDQYAGFIRKWFRSKVEGLVSSATGSTFFLMAKHQNLYDQNYFIGMEVKIIGGTGIGQTRRITASTKGGDLTVTAAWTTQPDATSFYRITQFAKFPRPEDVNHFTEVSPAVIYKEIPEEVREAVAAQVEFINEMGNEFFTSDKADKVSESLGDYSYEKAEGSFGGSNTNKLIAPRAKSLLRGIRCISGGY